MFTDAKLAPQAELYRKFWPGKAAGRRPLTRWLRVDDVRQKRDEGVVPVSKHFARELGTKPHVTQNLARPGENAIESRTTRQHPGTR